MKYFDSHSHYYDERFVEEREGGADPLISALLSGEVSGIINVGTSPETCRAAIEQAEKYDNMYLALGIHPSDTRFLSDMDTELAEIENMIKKQGRKCVCLGEIGLDYHYPDTDKERQHRYFRAQMALAERLGLPVCIHDRDAHGDCFETVLKYPEVRGVFHSYSGSAEMAKELTKRGWYISFSGVITFKNARRVREVAAVVDPDRILVETDCPYLSPEPYRGRLNSSARLCHTVEARAEAMKKSPSEVVALTSTNARRLFGII